MPELPEVQSLAVAIARDFDDCVIARAELGSLSALKTYDPPLSVLADAVLTGTGRRGKFLVIDLVDAEGEPVHVVLHLSRAGWIHWRTSKALAPLRPGKSPVALRLTWADPQGATSVLDVTEAGTQKRLAIYVVRNVDDVPGTQHLGPDALELTNDDLAAILQKQGRRQLKTLLREQGVLSGIGNAYSDEILHAARLSPYAPADSLSGEQVIALYDAMQQVLRAAIDRTAGAGIGQIKAEKRAGLRVHGRTGEPCDDCGTTIAEVRLSDSSFQYCPGCQTGGTPLADRRMSRLLK